MTNSETPHEQDPLGYADELIASARDSLHRALEAYKPEAAGQENVDLVDAFPVPTRPRNEAPYPDISEEQAIRLREAAQELGPGRPTDETISEIGLSGSHVLIDGGLINKLAGTYRLINDDPAANPKSIIIAADATRKVKPESEEAALTERFLGVSAEDAPNYTEAYLAERLAQRQLRGFVPLEEGAARTISFGYARNPETDTYETGTDADDTRSLYQIGHIVQDDEARPVFILPMRPEIGVRTAEGQPRRPQFSDGVRMASEFHGMTDPDNTPLAYVTSATYKPSRTAAAIRAALHGDQDIRVASFGTETMAAVKGTEVPTPTPLNQIPGEMHVLAEQVRDLADYVEGQRPTSIEPEDR